MAQVIDRLNAASFRVYNALGIENFKQSSIGHSIGQFSERVQEKIAAYLWPHGYLVIDAMMSLVYIDAFPADHVLWDKNMSQVVSVIGGEYNYERIGRDDSPIGYPAGHIYLFWLLDYIGGGPENMFASQIFFALVSVATWWLIAQIHSEFFQETIDRKSQVQKGHAEAAHFLYLLAPTARLLLVTRCSPDGIAMLLVYAALYLYAVKRQWIAGTVAYALSASIRSSALADAPALIIMLWRSLPERHALMHIGIIAAIHLLLGWPFLVANPWAYLQQGYSMVGGPEATHHPVPGIPREVMALGAHVGHVVMLYAFAIKKQWTNKRVPRSKEMVTMLINCNMIGAMWQQHLVRSRYLRYFHTMPFVLVLANFDGWSMFVVGLVLECGWFSMPGDVSQWLVTLMQALICFRLYVETGTEIAGHSDLLPHTLAGAQHAFKNSLSLPTDMSVDELEQYNLYPHDRVEDIVHQ
eukprot:Clim_evm47s202 gene=Clim_evmTU47s202